MSEYNFRAWASPVPRKDDFNRPIFDQFIDGKTHYGAWAIMTPVSHRQHGVGLGLGKGQRYVKREDGLYIKVEG